MKKTTAWILLILMAAMALAPAAVYAEEAEGLEEAIRTAKEKFEIPGTHSEFDYDVQMMEGMTIWNLTWRSEDSNGGTYRVTVDSDGMVRSYYFHKPAKYEGARLPALSREEARERAEAFLEAMETGLSNRLEAAEDPETYPGAGTYRFQFFRTSSGIPFYGNGAALEIEKDTGEVTGYDRNWNSRSVFPEPEGVIGLEAAEAAFETHIGLELAYQYKMAGEVLTPYLVYMPVESRDVWIDAFTGERIRTSSYGVFYGGDYMDRAAGEAKAEIALTPEELEAVGEIGRMVSGKAAEEILRSEAAAGLDETFALESMRLEKNWPDRTRYRWFLSFTKPIEENGGGRHVGVYGSVDAQTGEILTFRNFGYESDRDGEAAVSREEALEAVEAFLERFAPERRAVYVLEEQPEPVTVREGLEPEVERFYSFQYTRRVEGIPFRANRITVGYDAVEKRIQSYDLVHFHTDFPPAEGAATLEAAHKALFESVGMELLYVRDASSPGELLPAPDMEPDEKGIRLVYGLKPSKPAILEAESLALLNPDGSLYREPVEVAYSDLESHYARKAVEALAEAGIAPEGPLFRPEAFITQKEFLLLAIHGMNYYMPQDPTEEDLQRMYGYLVREGILEASEKAPDARVRRSDAVRWLVRAMGYGELAEVRTIFVDRFEDVALTEPAFKGYAAIAEGLGIIRGFDGMFKPLESLKRGDGAILVYNQLSR